MRALLVALALAGCAPPYYAVQPPTGDRLWLVSRDGHAVIRCFDLTPDKRPYEGHLRVFCKEAEIYSSRENPVVEQSIVEEKRK